MQSMYKCVSRCSCLCIISGALVSELKEQHLLGNGAAWYVMSAFFQFMIKYFHLQYVNLLIMVLNFCTAL